ncbi:adenylate kinase [bacterium]|nr:adenylate kinase [bacterium]
MKQKYIFIGPPGSGKGTQTERLSKEYNLPHIDTGALLREEIASGSENGKLADSFMSKGQLVPIKLVAEIIKNRLKKADCSQGFILDGYPRSMEQAFALDDILNDIDEDKNINPYVFYFKVDEKLLVERLVNRRSCENCHGIFNLKTMKLDNPEICPKCGGKLIRRDDDTEEVAYKRFDTYFTQTAPLIDMYNQRGWLITLNAAQDIDSVYNDLTGEIKGHVNS